MYRPCLWGGSPEDVFEYLFVWTVSCKTTIALTIYFCRFSYGPPVLAAYLPQLFSHEKACKIRCWHSLPYCLFFGSFQIKNWNYSIFSHIWTKRVLKVCLKCELIWKLVIDIINKWCCITGTQFWQVFIRIFVYTKLGTYLPFHFVLLHLYVYLLFNEKCMCAIKFWVGK